MFYLCSNPSRPDLLDELVKSWYTPAWQISWPRGPITLENQEDAKVLKFNLAGTPKDNITVETEKSIVRVLVKDQDPREVEVDLQGFDSAAMTSRYQDGILEVRIPRDKAETPAVRKIEIT